MSQNQTPVTYSCILEQYRLMTNFLFKRNLIPSGWFLVVIVQLINIYFFYKLQLETYQKVKQWNITMLYLGILALVWQSAISYL